MKLQGFSLFTTILVFLVVHISAILNTAIEARAATATPCAGDNCLRALSNRYTATAQAFCSTYTTNSAATIPTYATSQCANNPSRVTSACSCLATSYYAPKPLHRVYGPADNILYTYYDDADNIRSDDLASGSYDMYLNNCRQLCTAQCQTISFGIAVSGQQRFYLCYAMRSPYDPTKIQSAPGNQKYVIEERYQT